MANTTIWSAGDRVYCVAHPEFTGTVTEVSTISDRVRVDWDGLPVPPQRFDWWDASELEWYTRPVEVN